MCTECTGLCKVCVQSVLIEAEGGCTPCLVSDLYLA